MKTLKSKLLKYKGYRVSPDGSYIEYDGDELNIKVDSDGYRYADDGWWDIIYIDELIALAHRFKSKLRFKGDEGYYISHKDGNIRNYEPSSMEWKQVSDTEQTVAGHVYFDGYTVGKDGSIVVTNGKDTEKGQIRERWLDTDVNAVWVFENPIMVTFGVGGDIQWHNPDEYMAKAGYVAGNKSVLKDPVILHRDFNVENYNYDNLEWVEKDDARYIEYDLKRKQRQKDMHHQLNTKNGYKMPDSWPQ